MNGTFRDTVKARVPMPSVKVKPKQILSTEDRLTCFTGAWEQNHTVLLPDKGGP